MLTLNQRLQVCEFSGALFVRLLKKILDSTSIDLDTLYDKHQINYLIGYLERENAMTVVIESNYVDRHFLEDYANYHVRSFSDFGKLCTRIHFFDKDAIISKNTSKKYFYRGELIEYLKGRSTIISNDSLQRGYLGFTIIRPLTGAFIGRTCLRTYKASSHVLDDKDIPPDRNRKYYSAKSLEVNLFGIKLLIPSTLPFQEQDSAVAACASSALWSFFYGTKTSNRRQIPSPSSITRIAESNGGIGEQKLTGRHGLTPDLVRKAINAFDLEYLEYRIESSDQMLKEIIHAYQKDKNEPILLGVDVYKSDKKSGKMKFIDGHLITITGYEYSEDLFSSPPLSPLYDSKYQYRNVASSITKIYCHDDNLGPFARFDIEKNTLEVAGSNRKKEEVVLKPYIKNKDKGEVNLVDNLIYIPKILHLGIYHKIRTDFVSANTMLVSLNGLFQKLIEGGASSKSNELKGFWKIQSISWELKLTDQNQYKEKLLKAQQGNSTKLINQHYELLVSRLPRFLWSISCYSLEKLRFEVLIDATSYSGDYLSKTNITNNFLSVVYYSENWEKNIELAWREIPLRGAKGRTPSSDYYTQFWYQFINEIRPPDLLDDLFGDVAFPTGFHKEELDINGNLIEPDEIYHYPYRSSCEVENSIAKLEESKSYNWLIDEFGDLYIGHAQKISEENSSEIDLGHPTLINGGLARIAGELKYENSAWRLSNESGRYTLDKDNRGQRHLKEVVRLMDHINFIESAKSIEICFKSSYSTQPIRSVEQFIFEIGISDEKDDDFRLEKIELAITRLGGGDDDCAHKIEMFNGLGKYILRLAFDSSEKLPLAKHCLNSLEYLVANIIEYEMPQSEKKEVQKSLKEVINYFSATREISKNSYCKLRLNSLNNLL